MRNLSNEDWHHVAVSVSSKRLALFVDCSLVESVDWVYPGMDISTDGLLMVGGIVEGFETPFEVKGFPCFRVQEFCGCVHQMFMRKPDGKCKATVSVYA